MRAFVMAMVTVALVAVPFSSFGRKVIDEPNLEVFAIPKRAYQAPVEPAYGPNKEEIDRVKAAIFSCMNKDNRCLNDSATVRVLAESGMVVTQVMVNVLRNYITFAPEEERSSERYQLYRAMLVDLERLNSRAGYLYSITPVERKANQ